MPSPRLLLLPVAAVAALALGGCIGVDPGPATTETRDVAAFSRIKADDQVDVNVRAGDPHGVVVRAGEKVIGDVRTEVRGETLYVSYDGPGIRDGRLLVEASTPALEALAITGAADVHVDGVDGEALDLRVSGAGDVAAEGRVGRLALDISGAGDADLAALAADEARVDVSGSGDADVRAGRRLDAEVSGSGDLVYRGAPALRQRVSGSGELEHAGA